jgi:tetratricopeptide (TPR) repeat protein
MKRVVLHAALCAALALGAATYSAHAADSVRPEVGKPLQEAQKLIKAHRGREAMAEIARAEAVPSRTAYENQIIAQMKAAASSLSGDNDATIRNNMALLESGKAGAETRSLVQGIAVAYYNKKEYGEAAKWTQRYFKEGGNDASMRSMLIQSYYLQGDCAAVDRSVNENRASETDLQMIEDCYRRKGDSAGYVKAMEALVVNYPKKEYWTILLTNVQKKPGFASDRLGVHVYRLRMATGNLSRTEDYMEMAQLALQAGVPSEAKEIVDKGYEAHVLGTGPEAARQQRLRDLIAKNLAESQKNRAKDEKEALESKDGNDLVRVGLNYVYEGNTGKGIGLIEQGIKKGGLKPPDDAKLLLGEVQLKAGQRQRATQTFREVKGTDGTADIARLWVLQARA